MAMSTGGALRAFVFGAVVGSVLDGFHTWSGATSYPSPILLRIPMWLPALYLAAGPGAGPLCASLVRAPPAPVRPSTVGA
jgi:hypothetical protein